MDWETSKKPLIIAHRGFTKQHLENTLGAVEAALKLGVDGVEVDLRLSADGELVVFHDKTLTRLADQEGTIEEMTLSGLRKVVLEGHSLPTLEELLDLVRDRALLNLELKTAPLLSGKVERKLLSTLKSFHLEATILVSSFNPLNLWRLKKIAPQLKRGYLVADQYFRTRLRPSICRRIAPFALHPSAAMVTPVLVTSAREAGQRIFVWTVNDEDVMKKLLRMGVDGIFTDRPDDFLKNGNQ